MHEHRKTWDEYFMRIAEEAATRATCDRRHVGAVVVRDKSILATGYNGSVRGLPHGVRVEGATLYCTILPCLACMNLVANAGIVRVVFGGEYHAHLDRATIAQASTAGIEIVAWQVLTAPA